MLLWSMLATTVAVVFFISSLMLIFDARKSYKVARAFQKQNKELNGMIDRQATTANDFLTSCRLISISRSNRTTYWTYARGEETFTIETMGLLSDNPREWEQLTGVQVL